MPDHIHIEALQLNHLLQFFIPEWHFVSSENFRFSVSVGPHEVPRARTLQRNLSRTAGQIDETPEGSLDAENTRFSELTWIFENKAKGDSEISNGTQGLNRKKYIWFIYRVVGTLEIFWEKGWGNFIKILGKII